VRIVIFGASGTVGKVLLNRIRTETKWTVLGTSSEIGNLEFVKFKWPEDDPWKLIKAFEPQVVINLIAKLNSPFLDQSNLSRLQAIQDNSLFPSVLNETTTDARMIHVSTNAVFSGLNFPYKEDSSMDGQGVYAESKIMGENNFKNALILRSAILGRSKNPEISIPNIIRSLSEGDYISVPVNEFWNGITADAFADFVLSFLRLHGVSFKNGPQHIIPSDIVTKYDLFRMVSNRVGIDVKRIRPVHRTQPISQVLSTVNKKLLEEVWGHTRYKDVPTIQEIVSNSEL
jgi:dTDP-4-dehydrorhamnose reductase